MFKNKFNSFFFPPSLMDNIKYYYAALQFEEIVVRKLYCYIKIDAPIQEYVACLAIKVLNPPQPPTPFFFLPVLI